MSSHPLVPIVTISHIGGACPVQGYGTVQAFGVFDASVRHWYFRARGQSWTLTVGDLAPSVGDDWSDPGPLDDGFVSPNRADLCVRGEYQGGLYAAGWMPGVDAEARIRKALDLWARGERGCVDLGPDGPDADAAGIQADSVAENSPDSEKE